jgi:hypothetical protein
MIDQATSTMIGAFVAVSGTILVWGLGNRATNRRETRLRIDEIRKRFLERQIEEFYGPLLAISRRINAIGAIRQTLIDAFDAAGHNRDSELVMKIRGFIRTQYFMPSHLEIQDILTRKLHLLGEKQMPNSFQSFLNYATQYSIQRRLWTEENIDNMFVKGPTYPEKFAADIESKFARLMGEYQGIQGRQRNP